MRAFILFFLVISHTTAWAWGATGHRAIGKVAENHLSKKALKEVKALLGTETLAEVSTWMDEIRSDDNYDYTHRWHYATIPNGKTYATRDNNEGELVDRIMILAESLSSEDSAKSAKCRDLKFLVHLIGDLHQPLHVGNGTDRGGNNVKVQFFYEPSNLHRVWDSGMIDRKKYSYTELAMLVDDVSQDQIEKWSTGTAVEWAEECMQYRDQVYDIGDPEKLGYVYMYQNWSLVELQIQKAGIRLAHVLNTIYG